MFPPPPPPPDFPNFGFDSTFPAPPPLPSSADLFSSSETNDLFGFLDSFGFDFDAPLPPNNANTNNSGFDLSATGNFLQNSSSLLDPPAPSSDVNTFSSLLSPSFGADLTSFTGPQSLTAPAAPHPLLSHDSSNSLASPTTPTAPTRTSTRAPSKRKAAASNSRSRSPGSADGDAQSKEKKALLSSPQKRLNHILSEQKRRNAIRDGYASLTTLLAPAGAPPGSGMPTRGRPKGSGASGRGRTRGKSGVLFRAVEYVRWLEEGVGELEREVGRVEMMASVAA
ncbi:unnamed protein product [Peniophora sp. CBMAI 1063]|nr:unnamed protein product [Peniophora sp. CBMAI 1063]